MISPNRRKEDLPPVPTSGESGLETQRHRAYSAKATKAEECKCGVYFAHVGTHGHNKRHGFLEEYLKKEEKSAEIPPSSPSILPSRGVSRILVRGYSPSLKFVKHFPRPELGRRILGVLVPLVPTRQRSGRVVNPLALQVVVTPVKWIPQ